jgi:hypothetical protein
MNVIAKGIVRKVVINTVIVTMLGCGVAIAEMSEPREVNPPPSHFDFSTGQIVVDG